MGKIMQIGNFENSISAKIASLKIKITFYEKIMQSNTTYFELNFLTFHNYKRAKHICMSPV